MKLSNEKLKELHTQGLTDLQIAKNCGVKESYVKEKRRKLGLPMSDGVTRLEREAVAADAKGTSYGKMKAAESPVTVVIPNDVEKVKQKAPATTMKVETLIALLQRVAAGYPGAQIEALFPQEMRKEALIRALRVNILYQSDGTVSETPKVVLQG